MHEVWIAQRTISFVTGAVQVFPLGLFQTEDEAKRAVGQLNGVLKGMLSLTLTRVMANGQAKIAGNTKVLLEQLGISSVEDGYVKAEIEGQIVVAEPRLIVPGG